MALSSKQPTLFEVFGRSETSALPEINQGAVDSIVSILSEGDPDVGKVILLKSPRAGYGKTLLLQAVKRRVGEGTRFFAVEPSGGGRIDGEVVLDSVLRQLSVVLPASGGLTEFDFFARRLLATGLRPLLISGEIPSHDREGALFAIENRPIETFDFHHQQAATAHWTQANFEVLGPRLAAELSEVSHCGLQECAYWIDLLFKYATTAPERVERTRYFTEAVFGDLKGLSSSASEERLQSLLGLLALVQPIVLVFDETEGLSNRPEMGLKVAAFVVQLRQACPGLTILLSLNEDVWETGLTPLMPGGLEDRLTEYVVSLKPLKREEGVALVQHRFGNDADRISEKMEWPEPIYSRSVLKNASNIARRLREENETSAREDVVNVPPPLAMAASVGLANPPANPPALEPTPSEADSGTSVTSETIPDETESSSDGKVETSATAFEQTAVPEEGLVEVETEAVDEEASDTEGNESGVDSQGGDSAESPSETPSSLSPDHVRATKIEGDDSSAAASSSPFSIVDEAVAGEKSPFEEGSNPFTPEATPFGDDFAGGTPSSKAEPKALVPSDAASTAPPFQDPFAAPAGELSEETESKKDSQPFEDSTEIPASVKDVLGQAAGSSPFSQTGETPTRSDDDFAAPATEAIAQERKAEQAQVRKSPFDIVSESSSEALLAKNPFEKDDSHSDPASNIRQVASEPAPKSSPFDIVPEKAPSETLPEPRPKPEEYEPQAAVPKPMVSPAFAPLEKPADESAPAVETSPPEKATDLESQEVEDLLNQFKKRFGQPGGSA